MPEDSIVMDKVTGKVTIVLGGETYKLRRPTIGELRSFDEKFSEAVVPLQRQLASVGDGDGDEWDKQAETRSSPSR